MLYSVPITLDKERRIKIGIREVAKLKELGIDMSFKHKTTVQEAQNIAILKKDFPDMSVQDIKEILGIGESLDIETSDIIKILWIGLQREEKELSLDDVYQIVEDSEISFEEISAKIGEAIQLGMTKKTKNA